MRESGSELLKDGAEMRDQIREPTNDFICVTNRRLKVSMEKCEESLAAKLKSKQVFGSGEVKEDRITCLKFDASGEYLCLGDNEGRIIIFKAEGEDLASDYQFFTEVFSP